MPTVGVSRSGKPALYLAKRKKERKKERKKKKEEKEGNRLEPFYILRAIF